MLRRSYFEIFQTWKIFGIRHLPNPKYKNFKRKLRIEAGDAVSPKEAKGTDRFHRHHSAPPKLKRILLTRNQFPMSRLIASMNKPHAETKDVILYPIEEAIEDMFVLFFNDILVLSLLKGRDRAQVIDYKDIESKFFSIARKLVPTVTPEECKDVLENAPTRKIEPEGVQLVFPDDALREISDYLTSLVDEVLEGRLRVEDIVRYNEQENTLFFHTPRLVSILEKHDETRGLARPATPPQRLLQRLFTRPLRQDSRTSQNILNRMFARPLQQEYWTALRPVYFPVDLAPQTAPSLNQVGRHRTAPE